MYQKIVLGTAQFGMKYGIANKVGKINTKNIFKLLDFSKKNKINILDTASAYLQSEKEIGRYIKEKKRRFRIITKYSLLSKKTITQQFEQSIKMIGHTPETVMAHSYKDYIDYRFQNEIFLLKKKYPIKYVGVSLYNPSEFYKIMKVKKPDLVQVPCNILDKRFLDKNIIKVTKKYAIKIDVRSVFLQGLLFKKSKFILKNFKNVKKTFKTLELISQKENLSISELSLLWIFSRSEINNIIIGIDSLIQLKENLKILKKKFQRNHIN